VNRSPSDRLDSTRISTLNVRVNSVYSSWSQRGPDLEGDVKGRVLEKESSEETEKLNETSGLESRDDAPDARRIRIAAEATDDRQASPLMQIGGDVSRASNEIQATLDVVRRSEGELDGRLIRRCSP